MFARVHIPKRLPSRPRVRAAVVALAAGAALALVAACQEPPQTELKGTLGPGEGGPKVTKSAVETHELTTLDGTITIGALGFDSSQFLHYHPDPEEPGLHVIATITLEQLLADLADDGIVNSLTGDDLVIAVTPIVGRPDTPCRFQAALLARDERYEILAAGDRKTDTGRELHQVNLINKQIPEAQRFYCYELDKPNGAQLNVLSVDEEHQEWRIVHAVLNSVEPN